MKKNNRNAVFFALVLVFLLIPSMIFAATFKDTSGHWAEKNIEWAVSEGYISGYPDGSFKPNAPISKAEYYRITNQFIKRNTEKIKEAKSLPELGNSFNDVNSDDWYYEEVKLGVEAGYIPQDGQENLNPDEAIMREEAIWIFAKNQDWQENAEATNRMLDFDEISDSRRGLVGAAIEHNVVKGNEKGELMPNKTLTRAEVVTMIANFLYPEGVPTPEPTPNPSPQGKWFWSFNNSDVNFPQGYKVNADVLNKYAQYFTASDASIMRNKMRRSWFGSCYGMTATAGLYKEGRLKTTGLNTPDKSALYDVEPQSNYKAQSTINVYQLSQSTKKFNEQLRNSAISWREGYIKNNTNDLREYANNLKQMINKAKSQNTTVQLAYFWGNVGHANVIYDYVESPDKLILKVYDPNYTDLNEKEVTLDLNRSTMTAKSAANAGNPSQDINIRSSYAKPTNLIMQGVKEISSLNDQSMVLVNGESKVTIKSGNESWTLDPSKGVKELDSNTYTYYIPARDSYTVNSNGDLDITISGKNYSVALDTDSFTKALVTPRSVNIEGQKGEYYINLARDESNNSFKWNAMEVTGKDANRLSLAKEDFGFTLRGDKLTGANINALDKFIENKKTYNGNDKMVQIRQDGSNIKLVPNKYGNYDVAPNLNDELVGSWIGKDVYGVVNDYGLRTYDTESTLFVSKNPDGTYKVVKRVEVPDLGKLYGLEYNPVRYNANTKELELRTVNCKVIFGDENINGANNGPKLIKGQLFTDYGNGKSAHYTKF